jgi:tripartite-type tricarboxylate transporter receptor subunit TctC
VAREGPSVQVEEVALSKISRRSACKALAATALLPLARPAIGQGAYPGTRTIKMVVPYPAGGATDIIGRVVADRMHAMWGATVIVENISGAAGSIGMDRIAKGPTDGSQILMVPPQIAINQFLYAKLAFDPEKDLVPIAQVARLPNILVVRKSLEVNSVKDLIAHAKANPGKLNYASSGSGSTIHLSAELFKKMAGVEMNHVPYRGSAPAVNDLVGGQVDLMFDNATSIIGQVRGDAVKALAVTSIERSPLLPELPTVADTLAGYDTASWFGVGVRSGTPEEIIATIEKAARALTQEAIVKERFATVIADPVVSDRKAFGEFVVAERKKWGALISELKIRVE